MKVLSRSFPFATTDLASRQRWGRGTQIVAKISYMPSNEKSYLLSEIRYVGKVLDQEGHAGFNSSASPRGMG